MKKGLAIILVFAVIFAFAACTKNPKQEYVAPPTEVITFENGSTAVYEVVTDTSGVAVTDANGETQVIPYDPPVTEKGGYLVTDPEGSTIKQSATTAAQSAAVDNDIAVLGTEPVTTSPNNSTTASTTELGSTPTVPVSTTAPDGLVPGVKPPAELTTVNMPEPETHAFNGTLSRAEAMKLAGIMEIENRFDEALCDADYNRAAEELPLYIADIEKAVAGIKADMNLYKFVGDENLNTWLGYMKQAQDDYAVFLGIYSAMGQDEKPSKAFYATYEAFQNSYRMSLQAYYHIKLAAEDILYS